MTTANELIDNPRYFAYKFNFDAESIEFIVLQEGDIERATWLNRAALSAGRSAITVPIADLMSALNSQTAHVPAPPVHFIFHTAYCGSTFLSRCLEVEDLTVSLREPQILLDAANAKRLQWRSQSTNLDFRHLPALAMRLLQKHAQPNQVLIIKPINSVNNIVPELLQVNSNTKALMLYTDARSFLLSTLKKGEEAKQTVRAMFDLLRCDFPHLSGLRITDAIHMSDLKVTLTLWRLQIEQAEQLVQYFAPNQLMASLHAEHLIANPLSVLTAVNRFFELGLSSDVLAKIASSDIRFQDAKNARQEFSAQKRADVYHAIESFYGADLEKGYAWLTNNNPTTNLTPELSGGLTL